MSELSYRDEVIGGYRVRLVYSGGSLLGAIVETSRGSYYVPRQGDVIVPLPKRLRKYLERLGFQLS